MTHVQVAPAAIIVAPPRRPASGCSKGLAVTQFIFGAICGALGIAAIGLLYNNTWTTNIGVGIWCGAIFGLTGLIGILSTRNTCSMNGFYMALCIISTIVSVIAGIICAAAVVFYALLGTIVCQVTSDGMDCGWRDMGLGLFVPVLIICIAEFFVSIIAACLSCQNGCCGGSGNHGTVIVQPAPYIAAGGPAVITNAAAPQYGGGQQYEMQQGPPGFVAKPSV